MRPYAVFGLDGTMRPPQVGRTSTTPPRGLARHLHGLRKAGIVVAGITGHGLTALQLVERSMNFRFDDVAGSGGGRLVRRGGFFQPDRVLVPLDQARAVGEASPHLDQILKAFSGQLDDRELVYRMSFDEGKICAAAAAEVKRLIAGNPYLRCVISNDGKVLRVLPLDASKQLLVDYLTRDLGRKILVAAGDSSSDVPQNAAAEWPIVCRAYEGAPVNEELADMVRTRGVGYIAEGNQPHAYGLMAGLDAGREAGVFNF